MNNEFVGNEASSEDLGLQSLVGSTCRVRDKSTLLLLSLAPVKENKSVFKAEIQCAINHQHGDREMRSFCSHLYFCPGMLELDFLE